MRSLFLILSSFIIIYAIFNTFNIKFNSLQIVELSSIGIILLFSLISIFLISCRLFFIFKNYEKLDFKTLITYSFFSFIFNVISFSGSGEIIKYYFLSRKVKKKNNLIPCFIIEKIFGVLLVLFLTFIIIFSFLKTELFILLLTISSLLVFFFIKKNFILFRIPYLNYYGFNVDFILKKFNKLSILFISFLIQLSFYSQLYLIIHFNYEIDANIKEIIFFLSLMSVMNAFPFTYSGFGAREIGAVIFAYFFTTDLSKLISITISFGIINLIIAGSFLLMSFLYCYFLKKKLFFDLIKIFKIKNYN